MSSDKASNARFLEMGDTASFSLQVVDTDDEPVAIEGLVLVVNVVEMRNSRMQDVTDEYTTDAHGRVEVSFTHDDPRAGDDRQGDQASVRVRVTDVLDADGEDYPRIDPTRDTAPSDVTVDWSDRDSLPWDLSISQSVAYHEASDEGSGVRQTVRASLVDQYGDAVSGAKIRFWSNANNADMEGSGDDAEPTTWNNGLGGLDRYEFSANQSEIEADNDIDTGDVMTTDGDADVMAIPDVHNYADERTTNRRGVATKSYSRDAEEAYVETIRAAFNHNPDDGDTDIDEGEDPVNNPDFEDIGTSTNDDPYFFDDDTVEAVDDEFEGRALDLSAMAVHYWATEADDRNDSETVALRAVVVDTDSDLVVVTDNADSTTTPADDDEVLIVIYDSNDQFNTTSARVTMSYFEDTLEDEDDADTVDVDERSSLTFELEEDPEDGVNRITNTTGDNPSAPGRCVVAE